MTVSCSIRNPAKDIIFKSKKDKASCGRVDCSLDECPLRKKGECEKIHIIGIGACPYGKYLFEQGPTQRSMGYSKWLMKREEENKGIPCLRSPAKKIAFIGDYVYLPYYHMSMNMSVPFLEHSNSFCIGSPFIKREHWTIDTVLKILSFRPQALMGGEITSYQRESVPQFLAHLREEDKGMWSELIKVKPELDVAPNYIGRKALLNTLNFPIEWTVKNEKYGYPVTWKWDGRVLTTDSKNIYSSTWGGDIKMKDIVLTGTPDEKTAIDVFDNSWVNEKTVFVN